MQDNNENPQSTNPLGVQQNQPQMPHDQEQNVQSTKEKMSKKEKKLLWTGVALLLTAPVFILLFHDIPQLIADINNIRIGWGDSHGDSQFLDYYMFFGLPLIFFTTIPLLSVGSFLIARSFLKWQKAKYVNIMSIIFTILIMFCIAILVVGIFVLAGIIWRSVT